MDAVTQGVGAAIPLIERRLESPAPLSEDGFRYLVFNEFLKAGVDIMRLAPEYPRDAHAKGVGAKIDIVILDEKGAPETAIQFKHYRNSAAYAADAGRLLADFAKLRDFPNVQRFAAVLADGEMFRYLSNPERGLDRLFSLSEQEFSEGNIPKTKALRDKVGGALSSPVRTQATGMWKVGYDYMLFVWRVEA